MRRTNQVRCTRSRVLVGALISLLLSGAARSEDPPTRSGTSSATSPTTESAGKDRIVERINARIEQVWKDQKTQPAAEASDGEWCRRIYLDLLGRIPTVAELRRYLRDRGAGKRERLVDLLLDDSQYRSEYAHHWGTVWSIVLIGRSGGTAEGALTSRDGMLAYLKGCFEQNKPYSAMVRELIEAEGTTVPGSEQFNGATNFLVDKLEEDAVLATARTSQIFLGTQVQCTQCHDHPVNEWKQNQFWEFNAFFRQAVALRRYQRGTDDIREVELTDQDFGGEGDTPLAAEIYFQPRSGLAEVAYPVFLDGTALSNRSGFVADVCRRRELAALVVASPLLDQAIVNRMWRHFFSVGFSNPVDDLGPHREISHPELLDALAKAFREQGHDLKSLMRWITLSRPYALSSRSASKTRVDDPASGNRPLFSRFYIRQMTAEQVYESLLTATDADKVPESDEDRNATRAKWLSQFTIAFGTDEQDEANTFNGTIPQALMMFNGELVREATRLDQPNFLARVASSKEPPDKKIELLYLAALARMPRAKERHLANELLAAALSSPAWRESDGSSPGNTASAYNRLDPAAIALQDLWWALLNSNEFILIR
jgi:Protein of unknown function (DUF1549)/Protein of unknown function (DUF1553)